MMTRALDEGHRSLLVPETTSVVFDENNGKLVLISGELRIQESLKDPMYDISIKAVKLKNEWGETGTQHIKQRLENARTRKGSDGPWPARPARPARHARLAR